MYHSSPSMTTVSNFVQTSTLTLEVCFLDAAHAASCVKCFRVLQIFPFATKARVLKKQETLTLLWWSLEEFTAFHFFLWTHDRNTLPLFFEGGVHHFQVGDLSVSAQPHLPFSLSR